MPNWNTVREKIAAKRLTSKTWQSDHHNLHLIIDAAEKIGVVAGDAEKASISNLRTIIKVAKQAIEKQDRDRLSELFNLAATLTNGELRVIIGAHSLEEVTYEEVNLEGSTKYYLAVDGKQFDRIKTATKNQFVFISEEK